MNKSLVIAAVLMAAALTGILGTTTTTMAVYADKDYDDDDDDNHDNHEENDDNGNGDSSATNTEQKLRQSNIGSGNNTNCGQNLINSEGVVCFDPSVNVTDDTVIPL
jgi:archaellum component FlaG (FlaF/FlaG flagellin family)